MVSLEAPYMLSLSCVNGYWLAHLPASRTTSPAAGDMLDVVVWKELGGSNLRLQTLATVYEAESEKLLRSKPGREPVDLRRRISGR